MGSRRLMPPPIHPSTNRSGVRLYASPRSSAVERADGLVRWPLCRSVSSPGVVGHYMWREFIESF
ncbi:MAG: hypothetical protein HF560_03960 [Synechococcus sp. MIT S9220]|uniref:hypothetical protein n=1 Tax=unclassified Synechococcus TaxID=2626047 RepID=UPI00164BBA7A|nr:hypothetical protein [Synechococcus sp. MIT S9220]NOL46721.1 hypothetical protein [Synechococcus sp. MIT S9220]